MLRRGDISFMQTLEAPPPWRTPEEPSTPRDAKPGRGARGRRRGLAGQRADAPSTHQRPGTTGVEGAGGSGGHGRASRSTTPSAARVWRSRGRAAAHRHTQRPGPQSRTGRVGGRPRRSPAQQAPGYAKGAGTEVPAPHSATASSRLRPNDRQSWRRRRIHRNMPPTTAAPRPAPPIRPSKPVRARR